MKTPHYNMQERDWSLKEIFQFTRDLSHLVTFFFFLNLTVCVNENMWFAFLWDPFSGWTCLLGMRQYIKIMFSSFYTVLSTSRSKTKWYWRKHNLSQPKHTHTIDLMRTHLPSRHSSRQTEEMQKRKDW